MTACQPRIPDPSNPNPSSKLASVSRASGTVKCFCAPPKSVNRRSTARRSRSRQRARTSRGDIGGRGVRGGRRAGLGRRRASGGECKPEPPTAAPPGTGGRDGFSRIVKNRPPRPLEPARFRSRRRRRRDPAGGWGATRTVRARPPGGRPHQAHHRYRNRVAAGFGGRSRSSIRAGGTDVSPRTASCGRARRAGRAPFAGFSGSPGSTPVPVPPAPGVRTRPSARQPRFDPPPRRGVPL